MKNLCNQIDALLAMDEAGALVPHGIGGHARELLNAARAEIARLTDAGAEEPAWMWDDEVKTYVRPAHYDAPPPPAAETDRCGYVIPPPPADAGAKRDAQRYRNLRSIGAAPNGTKHLEDGLVLVAQILDEWIDKRWPDVAPPPPAAADRGVPGQRVSDANLSDFLASPGIQSYITEKYLTFDIELALDLLDCRAALATAPKAEDVRRKAIEECARRVRRFQDIVGWQPGESRNELVGDIEDAVRSLAKAAQ